MYLDRNDFFRDLKPEIKKKIKALFEHYQFGQNKLWAISVVPVNGVDVVDLHPHFDLLSIGTVKNSFTIFRGDISKQ